jgi:dTDP-4-dehydrorhamnose reductase
MAAILITGANGLVARALLRRIPAVGLTHAQLEITDRDAVFSVARGCLVINCAVIGVEESERDPALAEAVNVRGPALLAEAAERLIHFSSNYVLDPVNVYARTKLEGERAIAGRATIVRTSWVFGAEKESFFSTAHRSLRRGERVQATSDTFACTTWVEHLAARVEEIIGRGDRGLINVANDGVCSHELFAREAARIVGADPALIDVVSEADLRRTPRPRSTAIVTDPPLPHWRDALAAYIESADA